MATYAETQTRIAGELSRSDLTAEIKDAILTAVEYYKRRRFWWNETSSTLTCTTNQPYVALPSDFVELDRLQVTVSSAPQDMCLRSMDEILDLRAYQSSTSGQPTDYALYQDRVELYRTPNTTYSLPIYYIKALTALSAGSDTNAWLTEGEELIRLHAKCDLYANKMGNAARAQDMRGLEEVTLLRIESHNQRRTATGRIKAHYL